MDKLINECDEIIPNWLRFIPGTIDSQDISLNISRQFLFKLYLVLIEILVFYQWLKKISGDLQTKSKRRDMAGMDRIRIFGVRKAICPGKTSW